MKKLLSIIVFAFGIFFFSGTLHAKADFACDQYPQYDISPRSSIHSTGISFYNSSATYYRPYGVCFPSFNNAIDTSVVGDERDFLKVMRLDANDAPLTGYVNSVSVNPGEFVSLNAFVHNNGFLNDPRVVANGVKTSLTNFSVSSQGYYVSPVFNTSQSFSQSISASNTTLASVSDSASVSSLSGKKIRLRYLPNNIFITSAVQSSAYVAIHPSEFLVSTGASIGSIGQERSGSFSGSLDNSMYTYAAFYVDAAEYDLWIDKTVRVSGSSSAYQKTLSNISTGTLLEYKLDYKSLQGTYTMEADGVILEDDYDESKITLNVSSLPAGCSNVNVNGNYKIRCDIGTLLPTGNVRSITYTATVRDTATGNIVNTANISATPNYDINMANNTSQSTVAVITPTTPTCTLTANPTTIQTGGTSTLSWTTTNATSASINQGIGAVTPVTSGNITVSPTTTTTYTMTVTGTGGTSTCIAQVSISAPNAPTCTLTTNPTTIQTGGTSTLSWTTTNATSASINQGIGAVTPVASGNRSVSPTATTTYTMTVTGTGGTSTCIATINISSGADPVFTVVKNIYQITNSQGTVTQTPPFSPDPPQVNNGDIVHYRITITNTGNASGNVQLTDTPSPSTPNIAFGPIENQVVTMSGGTHDGGTLQNLNGITFTGIPASGNAVVTYTRQANANTISSPNTFINVAKLSTGPQDDATVIVNPIPIYELSKTVTPSILSSSSTMNTTYTIRVKNRTGITQNVTLRDVIGTITGGGSITRENPSTISASFDPAGSGTLGTHDAYDNIVIQNLQNNATAIITYSATGVDTNITAGGSSQVPNTVTLVNSGQTATANVTITKAPTGSLSLQKSVNPSNAGRGGSVAYAITVTNGTTTAQTFTLSDVLGSASNGGSITKADPSTITATFTGGGTLGAHTSYNAIEIQNLEVGKSVTIRYNANASNAGIPTNGSSSVPNTATIVGTNLSASASVLITGPSGGGGGGGGGGGSRQIIRGTIDLFIKKHVKSGNEYLDADTCEAGAELQKNNVTKTDFRIRVTNNGTFGAEKVVVKDIFESGSNFTLTHIQNVQGATFDSGANTFTIASVPANGFRDITFTADVKTSLSGNGVNIGRIESFDFSADSTFYKLDKREGVGRSDSACVVAGSPQNPGSRLSKTANRREVKAGEEIIYTLSFKNDGNVDFTNVILTDEFPSEYLEIIDAGPGRLTNNRQIEFRNRFLPAGETQRIQVKMRVKEGTPEGTRLINTLRVKVDQITIDDEAKAEVIVVAEHIPTPPQKIPQTGIPLSLFGTFLFMGASGYYWISHIRRRRR
jgi:uncharacterized repeat protein (TIGR01451 family)